MLKKDFPNSIKQNQISFTAKITNWGGGLQIGRGFNVYNSCYFIITDDKIELYKWEGSEHITLIERVGHGLSFQEYISIVLSERGDKALLVIQTLTDNFTYEFKYRAFNGPAAVLSLGAALSNCKLSICNPSLKSPLWMFGDSYYGSDGPSRQMYWLKQWGVLNCLVQGYGGQGSEAAYQDLVRCLSHGRPKYLVWSLGMNDDNSAVLVDITTGKWYEIYTKVRQLCELNDIELILTTIPEVRGDYPNKDAISEVVRNSGLRYIDAAKAVGSNADGEWYGNGTEYDYQSTDNVHPSEYGAKAIATQFLIDFPEIMQY
jgi:lysophospholipase L1-like esterase